MYTSEQLKEKFGLLDTSEGNDTLAALLEIQGVGKRHGMLGWYPEHDFASDADWVYGVGATIQRLESALCDDCGEVFTVYQDAHSEAFEEAYPDTIPAAPPSEPSPEFVRAARLTEGLRGMSPPPSSPTEESAVARLGSELETALDNRVRTAFARTYQRHPDARWRLLAEFALFKASAICHRLAGRIDEARLYEAYADDSYNRLPEADRW